MRPDTPVATVTHHELRYREDGSPYFRVLPRPVPEEPRRALISWLTGHALFHSAEDAAWWLTTDVPGDVLPAARYYLNHEVEAGAISFRRYQALINTAAPTETGGPSQ